MLETKVTTIVAEFVRIVNGPTPGIALHKIVTRPDGKQKSLAMTVPVEDEFLLARAGRELRAGDLVEVKIETHWAEEGIPKTLVDFLAVEAPQDQARLVAAG